MDLVKIDFNRFGKIPKPGIPVLNTDGTKIMGWEVYDCGVSYWIREAWMDSKLQGISISLPWTWISNK